MRRNASKFCYNWSFFDSWGLCPALFRNEARPNMMCPQQLRMARAGLGWTLADLAKKADVNPNTLSRYEGGKDVLSGVLRKAEAALRSAGVSFGEDNKTISVTLPLIERPKKSKRRR